MYNLEKIYEQSSEIVRPKGLSQAEAQLFYANYIQFIETVCPEKGKLLDAGCGAGWSSFLLSQKGFRTTGIDLNSRAFEPPASDRLHLLSASVTSLPFQDETFDIVASCQMLEHISDPQRALGEMLRVLKPGGVLCIVGPNLLGMSNSVQLIGKHVWLNRPVRRILFRDAQMARHPFGNTLPEALLMLPVNLLRVLRKVLSSKPSFIMRQPDIRPPFHADNDACYLCNPIDLSKWAKENKCAVIQNGKPGRSRWLSNVAGGTWIAIRKV